MGFLKFPIFFYDERTGESIKCHNFEMVPNEYKPMVKQLIETSLLDSIRGTFVLFWFRITSYVGNYISKLKEKYGSKESK